MMMMMMMMAWVPGSAKTVTQAVTGPSIE